MISIRTIYRQAFSLFMNHWQIFLISMIIPVVLSLVQQLLLNPGTLAHTIMGLFNGLASFVIITFQMVYILAIKSGRHSDWRSSWGSVTPVLLWRFLRAQLWTGFIIFWPALLIMVPLALLSSLMTAASAGIIGLFIALFAVGGIASLVLTFMRFLSYGIVPYLVFATRDRVRDLPRQARALIKGYRKKFVWLIVAQILLLVVGMITYTIGMLIVQPLNMIAFVLFAGMLVAIKNEPSVSHDFSNHADSPAMTPLEFSDDAGVPAGMEIEAAATELPSTATPPSQMKN